MLPIYPEYIIQTGGSSSMDAMTEDPLYQYMEQAYRPRAKHIEHTWFNPNHYAFYWVAGLAWEHPTEPLYIAARSSQNESSPSRYTEALDQHMDRYQLLVLRHAYDSTPDLFDEWKRQPQVETMLTINRRKSVKIFARTIEGVTHVIACLPDYDYEYYIRLVLMIPTLFHTTLSDMATKLLMSWLQFAQRKITLTELEDAFNKDPVIIAHMANVKLWAIQQLVTDTFHKMRGQYETTLTNLAMQLQRYSEAFQTTIREQQRKQLEFAQYEIQTGTEIQRLNEFVEFMYHNALVSNIKAAEGSIQITLNVPAMHIDLEALDAMAKRKYTELSQRILHELFYTGEYQLYVQATIILPLFDHSLYVNKDRWSAQLGLPNFHLLEFSCFGSNETQIVKAAYAKEYEYMFSALVGSVMNINVMDSTVWRYFEKALLEGSGGNYHAIQDKGTKRFYTCTEFQVIVGTKVNKEKQAIIEEARRAEQARLQEEQRLADLNNVTLNQVTEELQEDINNTEEDAGPTSITPIGTVPITERDTDMEGTPEGIPQPQATRRRRVRVAPNDITPAPVPDTVTRTDTGTDTQPERYWDYTPDNN